jgi:hypothetical protein
MMITLRRSLGSKFCAGLFILLIVMPFTAPFRAWDSGTPIGKSSSSDLKASDEFSNNTGVLAATIPIVPAARGVIVRRLAADGIPARPQTLRIVLRL